MHPELYSWSTFGTTGSPPMALSSGLSHPSISFFRKSQRFIAHDGLPLPQRPPLPEKRPAGKSAVLLAQCRAQLRCLRGKFLTVTRGKTTTIVAATVFCPLFKFQQKTRSMQQQEASRMSLAVGKVRAGSDIGLFLLKKAHCHSQVLFICFIFALPIWDPSSFYSPLCTRHVHTHTYITTP